MADRQHQKRLAANVVTNLTTVPDIRSASWQAIFMQYAFYGHLLEDYSDIAERFELQLPLQKNEPPRTMPGDVVTVADAGYYTFVNTIIREVKQINNHILVLEEEIVRRNQLIGVMG